MYLLIAEPEEKKMSGTNEKIVCLQTMRRKFKDIKEPESSKFLTEDEIAKLFSETLKKNANRKAKLKEEREKANKSVLKSYRIKD